MYALDGLARTPFHVPVPSFGELLKQRRAVKRMAQAQLAQQLGVQQQAVNRWENDKDRPRPETVRAISRILGISGLQAAAALGYAEEDEEAANSFSLGTLRNGEVRVFGGPPLDQATDAELAMLQQLLDMIAERQGRSDSGTSTS